MFFRILAACLVYFLVKMLILAKARYSIKAGLVMVPQFGAVTALLFVTRIL